jgi:inorganic pyrophosphatase
MNEARRNELILMQKLFKSHPWHGISAGSEAPRVVNVFIEIVPADTFKYEIDKETGMLRVDRPQRYSNVCPQMYGFVPQTYCMEAVAGRCNSSGSYQGPAVEGDSDPLDICVLAERPIPHGNVLVSARPIGGLRMIDKNEADDKILAVLEGDTAYNHIRDIGDVAPSMIERLKHYFLTYKLPPGSTENMCSIPEVYGIDEAHAVVQASLDDYNRHYPGMSALLNEL